MPLFLKIGTSLFFLFVASTSFAQTKTLQDTLTMICKSWKIASVEAPGAVVDSTDANTMKTSIITFNRNRTFKSVAGNMLLQEGAWTYNGSRKTFITMDKNTFEEAVSFIISLSADEFILELQEKENTGSKRPRLKLIPFKQ
jgi:hypothetical protein